LTQKIKNATPFLEKKNKIKKLQKGKNSKRRGKERDSSDEKRGKGKSREGYCEPCE